MCIKYIVKKYKKSKSYYFFTRKRLKFRVGFVIMNLDLCSHENPGTHGEKFMKKVMIFGDSYSTFEGCIPEGYDIYYTKLPRIEGMDVTKKEECWWHLLMSDLGAELVMNDSWSGSTICYTGYQGDCSATSSFITRLEKYIAEDFFTKNGIDTVFVLGGTNDSWADARLGKVSDEGREALFCVLPAIRKFLTLLRSAFGGRIIVITNDTEIKTEIVDCLISEGESVGATTVRLTDIHKVSGHPDVIGMRQIYEQVKAAIV